MRSGNWRGGRHLQGGYVIVYSPGHPRVRMNNYVPEHILVVERVLGRLIPPEHPIHHVNGDRKDNRHSNLVLCESATYHAILHARARAIAAGTHPGIDKRCSRCRQIKPVSAFYRHPKTWDRLRVWCSPCVRQRNAELESARAVSC